MKNNQAYKRHMRALKDLAAALGEADSDAKARWLRRTIRRVRRELYEMVVRDLESSTANYKVISDRLSAGAADLKRVRDKIDEIEIASATAARLVTWAKAFLPLL